MKDFILLSFILLVFISCGSEIPLDLTQKIDEIKVFDKFKIKKGFYKDCLVVITNRTSNYYYFLGDVKCRNSDILFSRKIEARDLF